jgi:hypothetical protein
MTIITRRRRALLVAVCAASVALAGCGSGSSNSGSKSASTAKNRSTTTTIGATDLTAAAIGKQIMSGSGMGEGAEQCVGDSVLKALGKAGVAKAMKADNPTPEQEKAVVDALDGCVKPDQFAGTLVDEFIKAAGVDAGTDANNSLKACVSQQLNGKVGSTVMALGKSTDDASSAKALAVIIDPCPTSDVLRATLKQELASTGASDAVIDCIVGKLAPVTKFSDLVGAGADGGAALQQKAAAAGQQCATAG